MSKKIYSAIFDGSYLGGLVIVQAENKQQAKELMRARIDKAGYVKDEIEEFKEVKITESGVIHFDNGDY